jgi:hypothetical protein
MIVFLSSIRQPKRDFSASTDWGGNFSANGEFEELLVISYNIAKG